MSRPAERPVLMSDAMVCAIIAGTKRQTRRVVTPQPSDADGCVRQVAAPTCIDLAPGTPFFRWLQPNGVSPGFRCPYDADALWVREAWASRDDVEPGSDKAKHYLHFRASYRGDLSDEWHFYGRWRPSIHLPRWASRITLHGITVRVERLHDISEADAKAEGVELCRDCNGTGYVRVGDFDRDYCCGEMIGEARPYRAAFHELWDSINGERPGCGWDANPWTWVVGWERAEVRT